METIQIRVTTKKTLQQPFKELCSTYEKPVPDLVLVRRILLRALALIRIRRLMAET